MKKKEYSFREEHDIKKLKKAWNSVIDPDTGSFYLTWEYSFYCCRLFRMQQFLLYLKQKRKKVNKVVFFVAKNTDKKICFIFPAVVDNLSKQICWLMAQYSSGSGYNDIICNESESTKLLIWTKFLSYLKENYNGYEIFLHDIRDDTIIPGVEKERPCVKIELYENNKQSTVYDGWYRSLSKSSRQNLRTAYNRLNKDIKQYEFKIIKRVPLRLKFHLYLLSCQRSAQINNEDFNTNLDIKKRILTVVGMYFSIFFHLINRNERTSVAVLLVEHSLAAFMIILDEKNGVVVPKLAINSDYSRYSPGCILISEYLKQVNHNSVFDLSRGAEPYKKAMGGVVYYNYGYNFFLV